MQESTNVNPLRTNTKKKADGFINLSVVFTDASGAEHRIKAPMFMLDADDAVQAALLQNPSLAEHVTVTIESIRKAHMPTKAADVNLNFADAQQLDISPANVLSPADVEAAIQATT